MDREQIEHRVRACLASSGEPETHRELFEILGRGGWLSPELTRTLTAMVGFRNVVVHGHTAVDLAVARDVIEDRLSDLVGFLLAIRDRLHLDRRPDA